MNELKKNLLIWIRANSNGQVKIENLKDFEVVATDEANEKAITIKVGKNDVLSLRNGENEFEIWFEVEAALDVAFYPDKFKFNGFELPVEDESGNPVPFETTIFRVKARNERYINLLKN